LSRAYSLRENWLGTNSRISLSLVSLRNRRHAPERAPSTAARAEVLRQNCFSCVIKRSYLVTGLRRRPVTSARSLRFGSRRNWRIDSGLFRSLRASPHRRSAGADASSSRFLLTNSRPQFCGSTVAGRATTTHLRSLGVHEIEAPATTVLSVF